MWRPFASSFVEHSLDSFIVKHEKKKLLPVYSPKTAKLLNPFQLSPKDLEKRLDAYKKLKIKVSLQREKITKNDSTYEKRIEKNLRYIRKKKIYEGQNKEIKRIKSLSINEKKETADNEDSNSKNFTMKNFISKGEKFDSRVSELPLIKKN